MQLKFLRSHLIVAALCITLLGCFLMENSEPNPEPELSKDATLSNLTIVGYDIIFSSSKLNYQLNVENDIDYVDITARTSHINAKIQGDIGFQYLEIGNNKIQIIVIAEDESSTKTYIIDITRKEYVPNSNAYLSSINTSIEEWSLNFDRDTFEYSYSVPYENSLVSINSTVDYYLSNVTGNGVYSLRVGENNITLTVVAEDGITSKNYYLKITRLDQIVFEKPKLTNLYVSGYQFKEVFSPDVTSYSLTVDHEVEKVNIDASYGNNISVSGRGEHILNYGINKLEVLVEDNNGTNTYIITITRSNKPALDTTSRLSSLNVDGFSLNEVFNPAITRYTVNVDHDVSSVNISAVEEKRLSTISGKGQHYLEYGLNKIEIKVTAEDGINYTIYYIDITRNNPPVLNTDSKLSNLYIDGLTFNETFDPDVRTYSTNVRHDIDNVFIRATANETTSSISGHEEVILDYGLNNIYVKVIAENIQYSTTYTIKIFREDPPIIDDSSLSNIELSTGVLSPGFDPEVFDYSVDLLYENNNITITPTVNNTTSTVQGGGDNDLIVGDNKIIIDVTAADGVSKSKYTITVKRGPYIPSTNAKLSDLRVKDHYLNRTFNKDYLYYQLDVPYTTNSVTLEADKEDSKALIDSNDLGLKELIVGDNNFTITVTAEDGETKRTYHVLVVRRKAVVDSTINFITDGDETITISDDKTIYPFDGTVDAKINEEFDSYSWYLNTNSLNSHRNEISLDVSQLDPGVYRLLAVVTKNGKVYSKAVHFTIKN